VANLDRIINAQIALRTGGVSQFAFRDLMLMDEFDGDARVLEVTAPDDILTGLGLDENSDIYKALLTAFSQIPAPRSVFIGQRREGESAVAAAAACRADNPNWYVMADVSHTQADILPLAAWAEGNQRLFTAMTADPKTLTSETSGVAHDLVTGRFFRTPLYFHPNLDQWPEVAAASQALRTDPGGETWANMELRAVQAVSLTETQYGFAKAKNVNTFEPFRNLAITQGGKVAGGEWLDVIRFRDWTCEEVRTRNFNVLVNNRIPYTDEGISVFVQATTGALDLGVRRKGIAPPEALLSERRVVPSYVVTAPRSTEVSISDKAARVLNDLRFTARLAGAIHAVNINGVLTYDNIVAA
jgi:hypothetical protein